MTENSVGLRRSRRVLLLLVVFGGLVKASYFFQYYQLPFIFGPLSDSLVYLWQAKAVTMGHHGDPSLLAMSPLYGYFLVLTGINSSLVIPIIVQLVLGSLNVFMIYVIVRRSFGDQAALLAAILYFGYGIFLFYETKLLSETLGLFLALACLWFYFSPRFREGYLAPSILGGIFLAFAILARPNLLLSMPFFIFGAMLPWSRHAKSFFARFQWLRTLGFTIGVAFVLVAHGFWNQYHSGLFIPVTFVSDTISKMTTSSWPGNTQKLPGYQGGPVTPLDVLRQVEKQLEKKSATSETKRYRPLAGFEWMSWLKGAPGKTAALFTNKEMIYQYGYYGERSELSILRCFPLSFGVIFVLALVGSGFLIKEEGWWALIRFIPLVLGAVATATLWVPCTRWRLFMLLPFIFLGGFGLWQLYKLRGGWRKLVLIILICLPSLWFTYETIFYKFRHPSSWDITVASSAWSIGDRKEAIRRISEARKYTADKEYAENRIRYLFQGAFSRSLDDSTHQN